MPKSTRFPGSWSAGRCIQTSARLDRPFSFESLEEKCVLSATGLDFSPDVVPGEIAMTTSEEIPTMANEAELLVQTQSEITSITILINQVPHSFDPSQDRLELAIGDQFEVTEITFETNANNGIFAVEGYINKLNGESNASLTDYNDGRFSLIEDNYTADGNRGTVAGLAGSWTAETGWDRLTVSLVHYQESSVQVVSRSLMNIQVGQPDFAFDTDVLKTIQNQTGRVGDEFDIQGAWNNLGAGSFHNYAEVNIYHSSNPHEIVWAGALAGNASSEHAVEGLFTNTNTNDDFPEVFVPARSGSYTLRFYLDPEKVALESNEVNNQVDLDIFVEEGNSSPKVQNDFASTSINNSIRKIDVLANDTDAEQDDLTVAEFSQAQNGIVELNEDGTFSYAPDKGFTGTDAFSYRISDGNSQSQSAHVQIEVTPRFDVSPTANGIEDSPIPLKIDADADFFTHVQISNVPEGASLSHGQLTGPGSYQVDSNELANLYVVPTANSDTDFELRVTPFHENTAFANLTETVSVTLAASVDGGELNVANFAIVTGASGALPFNFNFADLDGSESHNVTFDGLPDFVSLSAGEKVGTSWRLGYNDLAGLKISANKVDDLSDFKTSRNYAYKLYHVNVTVTSVEQSNEATFEANTDFRFYAIQRLF